MNKFILAISMIIAVMLTANITSAAVVEVTSDRLPTQLHEGDLISFDLKIDTDPGDKNISLETNLVSSDKPLFDFGNLNPTISENRYSQKIILDVSTMPSTFQITVSGKVPSGENRLKFEGTNLLVSKFTDTKLKYYEVKHYGQDQKQPIGIETFQLIINKKEKFDSTLNSINIPELDNTKKEIQKLFDLGLTTEAQDIANTLTNIKFVNSLSLFGIIKINDNLTLLIILAILCIISFIVGCMVSKPKPKQSGTDNQLDKPI